MQPSYPSLRWCAATMLLLGLVVAPLKAQESRKERHPDAVMLKRIAEAVDGNRSGALMYVVASYDGNHPVLGVFPTQKEAEARAEKAGRQAAVFGPYQTAPDNQIATTITCVHLKTSVMNFRCVPPGRTTSFDDIGSLTLMFTFTDGTRDSIPLPQGADAIFIGAPSIDKFVVPYYVRLVGLEATTDMRQEFLRGSGKP